MKLVVTIIEQSKNLGDKTLFGFELTQAMDPIGQKLSLLPSLASVLPKVIMIALDILQKSTGGQLHKFCNDDNRNLESLMAEFAEELQAKETFPSEIE